LTVNSSSSVAIAARRKYHILARALHPDRCDHPGADAAFVALGRAMTVIKEHISGLEDTGAERNPLDSDDAAKEETVAIAESDGSALPVGSVLPDGALSSWNPSRLVVQAHVLPGCLYNRFPQIYSTVFAGKNGSELLFLPLSSLPTMQPVMREKHPLPLDEDGCDVRDTVEAMVRGLEGTKEPLELKLIFEKGDAGENCSVEGILLVSCRVCLRGRFPLNGTYFQINEVFADNATVECPALVGFEALKDYMSHDLLLMSVLTVNSCIHS